MTVNLEQVRQLFALYASFSSGEAARWDILCRKAASVLGARLREDIDPVSNRERISASAALWAYGDYLSISGGAITGDEIKVGDITVKNSSSSGGGLTPARLKEQALQEISDLTVPQGFVFQAIGAEKEPDSSEGPEDEPLMEESPPAGDNP